MRARRNFAEAGFTLIEILASLSVFAVVATALASSTIGVIRTNHTSRNVAVATSLAQDLIEQFRALDPTVASDLAQVLDDDFEGVADSETIGAMGEEGSTKYTRSWTITNGTPIFGQAEVEVTVEWHDPVERSIRMVSYICVTQSCS